VKSVREVLNKRTDVLLHRSFWDQTWNHIDTELGSRLWRRLNDARNRQLHMCCAEPGVAHG
jgi:hypothetical protein